MKKFRRQLKKVLDIRTYKQEIECRDMGYVKHLTGNTYHIKNFLQDKQAAFHPHRSCVDQANTLGIIAEQSVELRSLLYLLFIDCKKAFDATKRSTIWDALRQKVVLKKIINITKSLYTKA